MHLGAFVDSQLVGIISLFEASPSLPQTLDHQRYAEFVMKDAELKIDNYRSIMIEKPASISPLSIDL